MKNENRGTGFAAVALTAIMLSSAACVIVGSGSDGDEDPTPGTTTTTTITTTGTTTTTTTTTTTNTCTDDETMVCSPDEGCGLCALTGPCAAFVTACTNNTSCASLNTCVNDCEDDACIDDCYDTYPEGETDYDNLSGCVVCDVCPLSCDEGNLCGN
ncbi:hypothetical protein [Chondromyces crocatus]|uniref:4Fe-4S ferredoxin-type domain-containing protein n=1 Tax=Chondromyces crocatus TaxID=52 RepID=A0A0K1E943_CHOCO|nr:hypothetical protein [Chondromyces crocatus]AKT37374.1 uncharacterized protein CMC5_015090 [Chondromyces crocatus]